MNENGMIRTFICLELPEKIRKVIDEFAIAPLRATGVGCSWVKKDNLHLTLKFLGDVPAKMIPKIFESVKNSATQCEKFSAHLENVGTFGGRNPRVVWVGIGGDIQRIKMLANSIDKDLTRLGFEPESRPFSPHLTIGRIRNPKGSYALVEKIPSIVLPKDGFEMKKIIIMKSVLSPGGSIYTPLHEIDLK